MELAGILLFIIGFLLGGAAVWLLRKKEVESVKENTDQLKIAFGDLSNEALITNQKRFLEMAEDKFNNLLDKSSKQLVNKKELIDTTLKEMKVDLKNLSDNTVSLKSQMEESRKRVGELSDTTSHLRQILSSSQARGQWGERMVKDILDFIGLVEGINYTRQKQISDGSERPDFTFYLPDEKSLNMDVKFPLAHYQKYIIAESESEKNTEKKAFLKDVRNRVKEVSKRSYINVEGGTVDYVLLFIPNESIYAFLNQEDHELIDFSLENKIMLCSPITLYAILSLVRQAVSNFSMEKKAGEMQKLVGLFKKQWEKYTDKIDAMGKTLLSLTNHYDELKGARLKALEKPMDKIGELQLGNDKVDK
ncbi:MAG: recombinase RmuC [Candidatus Marinimicrobia bacterium]|nr:recombinase RmuC [Candidatus Neomarinimicrobiota bacterium]|tara:strand:- start:1023 stop:2111 length:1089 start_codon:yes stop_codon:yes gene_type:complete